MSGKHHTWLAALAGVAVGVVLGSGVASGKPARKAAAEQAPAQKADVEEAAPVNAIPMAARCWDLGTTYGSAYAFLDGRLRARGPILENYCTGQKDPSIHRVPNDEDVAVIERELLAAAQAAQQGEAPVRNSARMRTGALQETINHGAEKESGMLDELLK